MRLAAALVAALVLVYGVAALAAASSAGERRDPTTLPRLAVYCASGVGLSDPNCG